MLYKAQDNEKQIIGVEKEDVYVYKNNELIVGYAVINDKELYINIIEKYRGNGYGNEIFSLVLLELKKLSVSSIKIIIKKDNFVMNKIVYKNGGILVTQDANTNTFVIPI